MKSKDKVVYFEYLRIAATIAVLIIHVAMGLSNNYSIEKLGVYNSAVMNSTYMLVNWAVPVFIGITGALLLNPSKDVSFKKVSSYIRRMVFVLLTFGGGYSIIELVFEKGSLNLNVIFNGFLNMLQGNSWSHMWYIYLLIGIYLVTIPLRCVVQGLNRKDLELLLIILVIGNFVIPTINEMLDLNIETYMQWGQYLTYYLIGYYLSTIPDEKLRRYNKFLYLIFAISISLFKFIIEFLWIMRYGVVCSFVHGGKVWTMIQMVAVFMTFRAFTLNNSKSIGPAATNFTRCSFAIYLIHPIFGNLFYKVLNLTPMSFQINFGVVIITLLLLVLSWATAMIMTHIPILKKYI